MNGSLLLRYPDAERRPTVSEEALASIRAMPGGKDNAAFEDEDGQPSSMNSVSRSIPVTQAASRVAAGGLYSGR